MSPAPHRRRQSAIRALGLMLAGVVVIAAVWIAWNPYPASEQRFDRGRNGLWVGHKWYTGLNVRSGEPVSDEELRAFVDTLARQRIRYAYVHVGPLLASGGIDDRAGSLLNELRRRTPDVVYLAWLGGIVARLPVDDPAWRSVVVQTVEQLRTEGFDGVHLNIEPLEDHHPGYLELLGEVRARLPGDFLLSHATRRTGPLGIAAGPLEPFALSEDFYRRTMELADQTVLMAYDTKMDVEKHYVGFVKHQTELLVEWGCQTEGHQILIGIPSYEDVPLYSNPEIENIETAAQGVRAALEELGPDLHCFEGVAIYANWVTDDEEWDDYRRTWIE